MVVSNSTHIPEKIRQIELPTVDLSLSRSKVSELIIKACEEFGFFKVVNHGVPNEIIERMEMESYEFFNKPVPEKQLAGAADPFGYGSKKIGFNGDVGEVEYLLLSTNPLSFSNNPDQFRCAVRGYIEAVRKVACEILEMMAEGLWVSDTSVFSRLIRTVDSDSLLRINHYPPLVLDTSASPPPCHHHRVGFGEHTDPQIITLLRSNDVSGLQISPEKGVWIPVPPDPNSFFVNVGDVLQALTNGRFVSVRHRAMVSSEKARISIGYFGGPPLNAIISCPKELEGDNKNRKSIYREFSWSEYKEAAYSLKLGESRLNLFLN
ncbi:gibberellin 2-beta-dioxygenase 2-like [Impatiens glandulifera]|uniref:gibberellin 2-beta-dioxygenase 2-like n=1 Tax=Impatiens glandulifera TaxID=253017 RepID=UPI001FB154B7|nr:gibberellin 2-beta-dioxygenase 2-like [Impatiens glandulifera]